MAGVMASSNIIPPLVGFVSLVAFPLLGLLSVLRVRVTPYLATLFALWAFSGLAIVGGGITPIEKGDIVTPEQREAWLASSVVRRVQAVWGVGIAVGGGLLLTTLVFENLSRKRFYKIAWALLKTVTFIIGMATFFRLYILGP